MINRSLFDGEYVCLASIDVEKIAVLESEWTHNIDYARRIGPGIPRPLAAFEIKTFYTDLLKQADESKCLFPFSVRRRADNVLLGTARLDNIQWNHRNGRLTLYLGNPEGKRDEWLDSLGLLIHYAFNEIGLNRLSFMAFEHEKEIINILEEAGFVLEIRQRECNYYKGQYEDVLNFGLLYSDWKVKECKA